MKLQILRLPSFLCAIESKSITYLDYSHKNISFKMSEGYAATSGSKFSSYLLRRGLDVEEAY